MAELFSQVLDLKKKDVFLETQDNDTIYFSVTGLPSTLSYGKHPFSITFNDPEGEPLLKNLSNIIFEFVDSRGTVIFSNLIDIAELSGAGNGFIWIKKDPLRTADEIADGPAFLYVMGELDGNEIPNEWKGIYNVRTSFTYDIRKDFPNTSPLILSKPLDIQTNLSVSESIDFDDSDTVFKRSFINVTLSDLETNGGKIESVELAYNEQNAQTDDFEIITDYPLSSGSFETISQTLTSGLNPITNTTKIITPAQFRRDTPVKFRLRFLNPSKQLAQYLDEDRQGEIVEVTSSFITFEGAPTIIEQEDNLLKGSMFTGNAVGKGFEQSGKSSAYLKTVDYEGFQSASLGLASGGVMFFSGSVLTSSGDNYDGVGMEMVANSESFFRFRTNPSELDIRTDKFFIGNETNQFISGSTGNIEISSSLFHLDPKNELLVIGTDAIINADLSVTNIRTPATIGGSPSTEQNASASITAQGFAKFVSASIGGFDVSSAGFTLGSTNVNIDSSNKAITINNSTFGQTGIQLDYNSGTPRAFIGKENGEFFKFDGSSVNISSSAFFLGSSEQFISGSTGNIEISSSLFHLDPSNNTMIISGTVQASDGNIGNFQIIDGRISGSNITFDANNSSIFKTDQGPGSDTSAAFDQLRDEYYIDFTPSSSLDPEGTEYYIKMGRNFMVDKSGILIASGAIFEGTVSASAGFLGGFVIESSSIHSKDYSVSISGSPTTNGFFISSSNFNVKGNGNITGSQVLFTGGKIGGFTIDADEIKSSTNIGLDSNNKKFTINNTTFGNTGIQLEFNGGTPRAHIGKSTGEGINFDGTNVNISSSAFNLGNTNNFISGSNGDLRIFSTGNTTLSGSSVNINTPKFFFGSPNQFVSGSNGNIEISSSNFHLDAAGNVDMSGTITATAGVIGGFTIGDDLSSTAGTLKLKGASGQITGSNVLFSGGKIAGFTISGNTLTATNFTLDATGKSITLGDTGTDSVFIADADTGIQLGHNTFASAPFSVTPAGVLKATSGTVGGFTLSATQITSNNLIIDSAGILQTSDYTTNQKGWRISSEGNGLAEFENVKIRGTVSTAVFEKETINAVGGQLYVANSTTLSGSGQTSASFATMSVANVSGFKENEILSLKKATDSGFSTEYILVQSASLDNGTSGKLFVQRGYGSGDDGDSGSLGGTPANSQSYEPGQVLVSTGITGSGFIRLNANPNDTSTPYMDIVERTGTGVYDVELKTRIGDLSGVAGTRNVPSDFTGFGIMSEVAFLSGSNIKLETPRFLLGDLTSAFVSGSNGNIEISSSAIHLTPEGNITASNALLENVRIVGGAADNVINPFSFTNPGFIGGGKSNEILDSNNSFLGGGQQNEISSSDESVVVGGFQNKIKITTVVHNGSSFGDSNYSAILGGRGNEITNPFLELQNVSSDPPPAEDNQEVPVLSERSVVVGGSSNTLKSSQNSATLGGSSNRLWLSNNSFLGGGNQNRILSSDKSFIGGGQNNFIQSQSISVIVGGEQNRIGQLSDPNTKPLSGFGSDLRNFIGGGYTNKINESQNGVIVGGYINTVTSSFGSSILNGNLNIVDSSSYSIIGGGSENELELSYYSAIVAGYDNKSESSLNSFIGGGNNNTITDSVNSFLGGGVSNRLTHASSSVIVGGESNHIKLTKYAFVAGGFNNSIGNEKYGTQTDEVSGSNFSAILGGSFNGITGSHSSIIVGGFKNVIEADFSITWGKSTGSFIGGGNSNLINDGFNDSEGGGGNFSNSTIVGGTQNEIKANQSSFIGGGSENEMYGPAEKFNTIGGGRFNSIRNFSTSSVIAGGEQNVIQNSFKSAIAGGASNDISSSVNSFIGGGESNDIYASPRSTILSGRVSLIQNAPDSTILNSGANNGAKILSGSNESLAAGGGTIIYDSKNSIAFNTSTILSQSRHSVAFGGGEIKNSPYALLGTGNNNKIYGSTLTTHGLYNTILNGAHNHIDASENAFIGFGDSVIISGSDNAAILSGDGQSNDRVQILNSNHSFIGVVEQYTYIYDSPNSVILSGGTNMISASVSVGSSNGKNVIIGGSGNDMIPVAFNGKPPAYNLMGVGYQNKMYGATYSVIMGGYENEISSSSTVGLNNYNAAVGNFIGGGFYNKIENGVNSYSSIVGGYENVINSSPSAFSYTFIGGGRSNHIKDSGYSSILGGRYNQIPDDIDDVFIIGSNITASVANTTHVENLYSLGNVSGSATSTASFGSLVVSDKVQGDLNIGGNIDVGTGKIYGDEDYNNYLTFNASSSLFKIQNKTYVKFDGSSAQREVTINEGTNDIDFVVKGTSNNPLLHADANTNRIGTHGLGSPEVDFHIGGSELRVDGNISGSSTSTGSFGAIGVSQANPSDKLQVNAGAGVAGFNTGITIQTGDGSYTANRGGMLGFFNEDVQVAGIRGQRAATGGWKGNLQFFTHNSTSGNTFGTTFLERMRIDESGHTTPGLDDTYNLGSTSKRWADVFAVQTTTGGVFETGLRTKKIGDNPTGTIVSWEEDGLVPCDKNEDELVMGVIKNGKDEPIVLGAEPVLVTGKVNVGDYIVTSDKIGHGKSVKRGYLLKKDLFGKVIAQALESCDGDSNLIKCMIRKM